MPVPVPVPVPVPERSVVGATRPLLALLAAIACNGDPPEVDDKPNKAVHPPTEVPSAPTPAPLPDLAALSPTPVMDWPVEVVHITSSFGWRVDPVSGKGTRLHGGLDLRGAIGDPVLSIADGTVVFAGHDALLGNHVIVRHRGVDPNTDHKIESFYGHLSDVLVHEGLAVSRGAAIGLVGNTGRSAAPHLHLTIKIDDVPIDPLELIGQPPHAPTALTQRPGDPRAPKTADEHPPEAPAPSGATDGATP